MLKAVLLSIVLRGMQVEAGLSATKRLAYVVCPGDAECLLICIQIAVRHCRFYVCLRDDPLWWS